MTDRTALCLAAAVIGFWTVSAQALDLFPRYQPREQTPSERLNNFRPPQPPPKQETPLDRAVRTYDNAPVRPAYDPVSKQPVIQYNKKF